MPKERKFTFIPLAKRERIASLAEKKHEPFVKFTKQGVLQINKKSMEGLGEEFNEKFVKVFFDAEKRALGFKFVDSKQKDDNYVRYVKPTKTGKDYHVFQFGVGNFLNRLKDVVLPTPRLRINTYDDADQYIQNGLLYFVIVPEGKVEKGTAIKL